MTFFSPKTSLDRHAGAGRHVLAVVVRVLLSVLLVSCLGCAAARVEKPLTGDVGGNDVGSRFEFWHQLALRPATSNDEAFHGLLLFTDRSDPAADYDERVRLLKSRGLLPRDFDRPADEAVRRGNLAVAVSGILGIRGGLMMRLTGSHPRYALLELEDEGLFPLSSANQSFSGGEFLGIVGRMEDYRRGGATASARLRSPAGTGRGPALDEGPRPVPAQGPRPVAPPAAPGVPPEPIDGGGDKP